MSNQLSFDELLDYMDNQESQFVLDSVAAHGFLTATVIGLPLPNWMDALFEGHTSEIPENVIDGITRWRDSIIAELKNETPIALPFNEDAGDEEVAVDFSDDSDIVAWSIGFVDAMYGDEASDWFEDEETAEDVAVLTLPMIVLSGIDDEDPELAEMRKDEDKLAQMANSIEGNLTELFLLFHTND
ncbi:YecA family protein [Psychrobacter sp. NZS113]|uniref:YecA/YgfB family protein n=1 Tax=Psychrobacter sp. NZS113 TaxID=2792045 RepID=UPI0018CD2F25|nr:YecA family protein [Psychrobacter sp. NZS113]MBH0097107.1 YecA family protein [Psychrobacter sp. NZS113]